MHVYVYAPTDLFTTAKVSRSDSFMAVAGRNSAIIITYFCSGNKIVPENQWISIKPLSCGLPIGHERHLGGRQKCKYFPQNFNDFASPGQPSPAQPSQLRQPRDQNSTLSDHLETPQPFKNHSKIKQNRTPENHENPLVRRPFKSPQIKFHETS